VRVHTAFGHTPSCRLTGLHGVIALLSSPDMPQILIRQLDQHVVRKLRAKAAADGVSAEEEARRILRRSLVGELPVMPLIEFLRTMPDAGDDRIFERPKRKPRKVKL
jgi:antitoxin FitA